MDPPFRERRQRDRPIVLTLPPLPQRLQPEPQEIRVRPDVSRHPATGLSGLASRPEGRPNKTDYASNALKPSHDSDAPQATRRHPQLRLQHSGAQASGAGSDPPKQIPKRIQIDNHKQPSQFPTPAYHHLPGAEILAESQDSPVYPKFDVPHPQSSRNVAIASNQISVRIQERGTGTDIPKSDRLRGQNLNGSQEIIKPEAEAMVPMKGSPPASRQIPDTVVMPWIEFSTNVEGEVGHYQQRSATATAYGGFSDIFQCDARFSDGSCRLVAVKRLRAVKMCKSLDAYQIDRKLQKRLKREVRIWTALRHPNIAPLLGFNLSGEVSIISCWFANGNIAAYLEANSDADRMGLIRQVASGVAYLHGRKPVVVHGDLKPDNVLIDIDGVAKLIDFGLSKAVEVEPGATALSSTSLRDVGNVRWIAPELLLEEDASRSCSTDTFSFGCLAFFIFTGDVPFKSNSDRTLYLARYNGARPMHSEADYPGLQRTTLVNILQSCWEINAAQRPIMLAVAQRLDQWAQRAKLQPSPPPLRRLDGRILTKRPVAVPPSSQKSPPSSFAPHGSNESNLSALRPMRSQVFAGAGEKYDTRRVKVKVHYKEDLFIIVVQKSIDYHELMERLGKKIQLWGRDQTISRVRYRDEDGDMISLASNDDIQIAFDSNEVVLDVV